MLRGFFDNERHLTVTSNNEHKAASCRRIRFNLFDMASVHLQSISCAPCDLNHLLTPFGWTRVYNSPKLGLH